VITSDSGNYGQLQINAPSITSEATILLSNGGSGQNGGAYTNTAAIGLGAYSGDKNTLIIGTGYSGGTIFTRAGCVSIGTNNTCNAALTIHNLCSGAGTAGNQLWLRGGNSTDVCNSNAIVFSYSDVFLYSHAIKTSHNSTCLCGNSIDFYVWNQGTDSTGTIGTRKMMIIDAKAIMKPLQPAFQTYGSSVYSQSISNNTDTKIIFPCLRYDIGSNVSDCGRFRAPFPGRYAFSSTVRYNDSSTNSYLRLYLGINGCSGAPYNYTYGHVIAGPNGYSCWYHSLSTSAILNLSAGDCVEIFGGINSGTTSVHFESQFSGYFLG
jgi:hypothetical protein